MLDTFICRYGHQDLRTVQGMTQTEKQMFKVCLLDHIANENGPGPEEGG
jgi:hypothetical protein